MKKFRCYSNVLIASVLTVVLLFVITTINIFTDFSGKKVVFGGKSAHNWINYSTTEEVKGTGQQDSPYLIGSRYQLANVLNKYSNSTYFYFKLTNNIDVSTCFINGSEVAINWTPIGTADKPFYGSFDGNGYMISGMDIYNHDGPSGLFGIIKNAVIKNLSLGYGNIHASQPCGGIAGNNLGSTSNISNCINYGTNIYSFGIADAGGIIGKSDYDIFIEQCGNFASINAVSTNYNADAGGIFSYGSVETKFCYNYGDINAQTTTTGYSTFAGGIGGGNSKNAETRECFNSGNITASVYDNTSINFDGVSKDCVSASASYAGGILGNLSNGSISNCYNTGNIAAYAVLVTTESKTSDLSKGFSNDYTGYNYDYILFAEATNASQMLAYCRIADNQIVGEIGKYASVDFNAYVNPVYKPDISGYFNFSSNGNRRFLCVNKYKRVLEKRAFSGGICGYNQETNPFDTTYETPVTFCYNTGLISGNGSIEYKIQVGYVISFKKHDNNMPFLEKILIVNPSVGFSYVNEISGNNNCNINNYTTKNLVYEGYIPNQGLLVNYRMIEKSEYNNVISFNMKEDSSTRINYPYGAESAIKMSEQPESSIGVEIYANYYTNGRNYVLSLDAKGNAIVYGRGGETKSFNILNYQLGMDNRYTVRRYTSLSIDSLKNIVYKGQLLPSLVTLGNAFSKDIWETNSSVNNGLPYLKCFYWQYP